MSHNPSRAYLVSFTAAIWSAWFATVAANRLLSGWAEPGTARAILTPMGACMVGAGICFAMDNILRRVTWRPAIEAAGLSILLGAGAAILWTAAVRLAIAPAIAALLPDSPPGKVGFDSSPTTALFIFVAWLGTWLSISYAEELREKSAQINAARDRVIALETLLGMRPEETRNVAVDHLWVPGRNGLIKIPVKEVRCFMAEADYVRLQLMDGREFLVRARLRALQARLDPGQFIQIHRSTIVLSSDVQAIERTSQRGVAVRLSDGSRRPVARAQVSAVRSLLMLRRPV